MNLCRQIANRICILASFGMERKFVLVNDHEWLTISHIMIPFRR